MKESLGITAFTEFKDSVAHGFKVMGDKLKEVQETETYVEPNSVSITIQKWTLVKLWFSL